MNKFDVELEAAEVIEVIETVDAYAVQINVPKDTTVEELIAFCDVMRREGYDTKISFEEDDGEPNITAYVEKE